MNRFEKLKPLEKIIVIVSGFLGISSMMSLQLAEDRADLIGMIFGIGLFSAPALFFLNEREIRKKLAKKGIIYWVNGILLGGALLMLTNLSIIKKLAIFVGDL